MVAFQGLGDDQNSRQMMIGGWRGGGSPQVGGGVFHTLFFQASSLRCSPVDHKVKVT